MSETTNQIVSNKKKKVLIVEDNKELADLYTEWLSEEYDVVTAYNGTEALEKYNDEIDVTLIDRKMPEISGDEVLEEIRGQPGECMAAMVTAVEPDYDILSMEFEDYIQKPITKDNLLELTDNLVTLSRYNKKIRESFELQSKSSALNLSELEDASREENPQAEDLLNGLVKTITSICTPVYIAAYTFIDGAPSLVSMEESSQYNGDENEIDTGIEDLIWDVYREDSIYEELTSNDLPENTPLPSKNCIILRIGEHGIILVFLDPYDALDESDKSSLRSATALVESSLESVKYKKQAQEKSRLSDEYKKKKIDLEKVNDMVLNTSSLVLNSKTRTEIEQNVCRGLSESPLVGFAWLGKYIKSGDNVICKYTTDEGYMESMTDNGEIEEAKRVAREKESIIFEDLTSSPPLEPWREQAIRHGFKSVIRIPVMHSSSFHGILNVYLTVDEIIDDLEKALNDIGSTVGHAISSYEAKLQLVSEDITELKVRVHDPSFPPIRFSSKIGTKITLEGAAPSEDETLYTFLNIQRKDNIDMNEKIEEAARSIPAIKSYKRIGGDDEIETYQFTGDAFFIQEILNQGGIPTGLEATPEEAIVSVNIPKHASTSSFVSMIENKYSDVDVLKTQEKPNNFETKSGFKNRLTDTLSDRQMETIQTAYHSGYFDSPRQSSGQDIADQMDVSQPTVTENIKTAQRQLLGLLFGP